MKTPPLLVWPLLMASGVPAASDARAMAALVSVAASPPRALVRATPVPTTPPDSPTTNDAPPESLSPLASAPAIVPLSVTGFTDAVLSIPLGATSRRPVLVATHGMWDPPEAICESWRHIVHNRAWVLCPRGEPRRHRTFHYASGPALAAEIDADVRALHERYPGYVDDGPMLYSGFSLGANLGVWVIVHDPKRFPRAVLIEGGEDRFAPEDVTAFATGGGQRVLFACGLRVRIRPARATAKALEQAGVAARVVLGKAPDADEFMHAYNGPVADAIKKQLDWLTTDDGRWATRRAR